MNKKAIRQMFMAFAVFAGAPGPTMSQEQTDALDRASKQLVEPFLQATRKMVEIESPSLDATGIHAMEVELESQAREIGAEIELIPASTGPGNNVVARWRGQGKTNILLVSHMDTVYPAGILQTFPWREEVSRIYGPGVLDDKGGIAMALMAVRLLREAGRDAYGTVTLLSTTDEEKQSAGSKELIRSLAQEHDVAFVLEFGTPDDRIVLSRKGIGYFRLDVLGKAAHAGAEPEKGCNAVTEIAFQILQMRQLERPELSTSFNFTILNGGERSNIIPAQAKAQADVRVLDPSEFDRLESDAAQLAATKQLFACSQVRTSLERGRPPFPSTDKTARLVEMAQGIYREIDMDLRTEASGAGTDGNYTAAAGTTTLDGLGPVGGGAHTAGEEYIERALIAPRIYLLARLIEEVSRESFSK
ncbi:MULTISPECIES: glutamate carboxypeptidase [Hyphomicrobiales]|uniref:M20/M25/M40 family metallo-hydrolase n=5 Tax=Hyphomicrobiales TaxID=356 RepID=A0A256GD69_9HYPH|nr:MULTISPECIES: glutamate carboxypeptidase [Hyphomicrobiales]QCM13558.1 M20 family peptidase [Agrobacterium tumefaciens]KAB2702033.1 M20/M25/M40 family metallo-hydrolase [Brucella lupini]OYR25085.1 peptidase dimerization domain protein [Brucella lupini]QIX20012.1 M20/M25/M40 family metallo-hydrolase [Agrobacterium pusense]CAD7029906.1 hippurate hydrolase [Rhizobium sp. P007]